MKTYRSFLMDLLDDLVTALSEAENAGWHHLASDTPEGFHYLRLLTWCREVSDRRDWHDNAKVRSAWRKIQRIPPGAEERYILGAPDYRRDVGGEWPSLPEPDPSGVG